MIDVPEGSWEIVHWSVAEASVDIPDRASAEEFLRRFKSDYMIMRHLRSVLAPTDPVSRYSDDTVIDVIAARLVSGQLVLRSRARRGYSGGPGGSGSGGSRTTGATGRSAAGSSKAVPVNLSSGSAADQSLSDRSPNQTTVPRPRKTWIAIDLVDQDGKPVPNEAYRIEAPDGSVYEGVLNDNGFARVDGIPPGLCKVSFPDVHGREWKRS